MERKMKSAALIRKGDSYFLVQERNGMPGKWNWVQGKIESGETPEVAALREGKEETGLELRIEKKLGVLENTFPDTKELHVFLVVVTGGTLQFLHDEILDARWFSLEEVVSIQDQLVGDWIVETIKTL